MEDSLVESIVQVCYILNEHSVEYLIVGGTAVGFHGFSRRSRTSSGKVAEKYDLDFWYNPTYKNYYNLLDALEQLGKDVSEFRAETTPDPKQSFFRFEFDRFTIDFLPDLPGLSKFRRSYNAREVSKLKETKIDFISYDDLIENKKTQGRPKDIEDIKELEKRRSNPG